MSDKTIPGLLDFLDISVSKLLEALSTRDILAQRAAARRNISEDEKVLNELNASMNYCRSLSSRSSTDIPTPVELVDKMISDAFKGAKKVTKDFRVLDPACGRGTYLFRMARKLFTMLQSEFPDPRKRLKYIKQYMMVGAEIDSEIAGLVQTQGFNIIIGDALEHTFMGQKFDIVIGNPPYLQNLHLKFIEKAINLLSPQGRLIFVHPATWILNEIPATEKVKQAKKLIGDKVQSIHLIHPDTYFPKVDLGMLLSITCCSNNPRSGPILVQNDLLNETYSVNNLEEINGNGSTPIYAPLRAKILSLANQKQGFLRGHENNKGKWYVPIATYMGGSSVGGSGKENKLFYSFMPKSGPRAFIKKTLDNNDRLYFGFKTPEEAENFQNYLKTYFARFCLSLAKFDRNIGKSTISTTPWLDFSRPWTDKDLKKEFHITKDEWDFILKKIPKYYDE